MQSANVPAKFTIPWANSASGANVRAIPTNSQVAILAGAASLTDGFPPLNFVPVSAGGIPPFGQDMNGILKRITQWNQWHAAGAPIRYDATFAVAIGGYPAGTLLMSDSGHAIYENFADNNTGNPNAGGANWQLQSCIWSGQVWQAIGSANLQTVTLLPAPTSVSQLIGIPIRIFPVGVNSATVFLTVNGFGPFQVFLTNGVQLAAGTLVAGFPYEVIFNGTTFILMTRSNTFWDPGSGGLTIQGTTAAGAQLVLTGNGSVAVNKFIRARSGLLEFVNSAYTSTIATITDTGSLSVTENISASNNIIAGNRLQAALGAFGTGNSSIGVILGDYVQFFATSGYTRFPNGLLLQWGITPTPVPIDNALHLYNFPIAFPSAVFIVSAWPGAISPIAGAQMGSQAFSLAQFYVSIARATTGGTLGTWWFALGA